METDRMELRLGAAERDGEVVPAARDAARVQRLGNVANEMHDPLEGLGARQVRAAFEHTGSDLVDTTGEDLGLVCDGADDAAAACTIAIVENVADARGLKESSAKQARGLNSGWSDRIGAVTVHIQRMLAVVK
jgi:hypothetical protein